MIFNSNSTDREIYESVQRQQNNLINNIYQDDKGKFSFSKFLVKFARYGMNYDDQVLKNMHAIPDDKYLLPEDENIIDNSVFAQLNKWKQNNQNENRNFYEKDLTYKIKMLQRMSMQPELEEILDILTNETIVYDDSQSYTCKPIIDSGVLQLLADNTSQEIRNALDTAFYKIYLLADWKHKAWNYFKKWLIEGVLAFEIEYDDIQHPKTIIGITPVDPSTLTKTVIKNTIYWIQYKGVMGKERTLIDSQIIYVKYEDEATIARQSYLERLIRPFNIYRIIEQAQIIWTVTQSSFKTVFTIPVGDTNKAKGTQTLNMTMNKYKEDISFNGESGELLVNGQMNLPFNREFWFPENSAGSPKIDTLSENGPVIKDNEQLRWFKSDLYRISKIPQNRFDSENQSSWFGTDTTQALRDELNYGRFVTRLRSTFGQILVKPLQLQLALSVPGISADKRILDAVQLEWNSYNMFEEMSQMEIDNKRIDAFNNWKAITYKNERGEEDQYFETEYLIFKFLHLSQADIDLNKKYRQKRLEEMKEAGIQNTGASDMGGGTDMLGGAEGGTDMFGGAEAETPAAGGETEIAAPEATDSGAGTTDITSDMLGNVQPESAETTQA